MVSIIIPVYNGEKFIQRCYDSLCAQTYDNWEAIFINDGSSDNSHKLITELAQQDNRLKIISRPNTGVAKAREDGIKAAKGDWIIFLDVDDWISNDALSNSIATIANSDSDVLMCGLIVQDGNKQNVIRYKSEFLTFDDVIIKLAKQKLRWSLCGNLYKRQLFDNEFITLKSIAAEDCALFLQILSKAKIIQTYNRPFYYYKQEPSSASHNKAQKYLEDAIATTLWCKNHFSTQDKPKEVLYALSAIVLLILTVCYRHKLPANNHYVQKGLKECFMWQSIKLMPPFKRLLIILYKLSNFISKR